MAKAYKKLFIVDVFDNIIGSEDRYSIDRIEKKLIDSRDDFADAFSVFRSFVRDKIIV